MSVRYVETSGSAKAGELVLVPDAHWRLSLAVNKGNAARALGLKVGGLVLLAPAEGPEDDGT
jgi:S-adenosylmethionine hydrolase